MSSSGSFTQISTTAPLVSVRAFHGIIWTAFSLCFLALALRLYVRYHCFRRLLVDDWVMMFAMALLLSVVVLGQVFMTDVYAVGEFQNGQRLPDATFPKVFQNGLRGFGAALTICLVGILTVKINFLLFFKRLGTQITSYLVFWYTVLFVTVACGATNIGLMDYKCVFSSVESILLHCTQPSVIKRYVDFQMVSVILDVISDALIMCFPIVILWNVRISLRKKIILTCTFGLVALTIAVTIVRGSVFGGVYKSFNKSRGKSMNMSWMWFWMFMEFAVAFLIACIVSFRALFAQRENSAYENQMQLREIAWQEQQASSRSSRLKNVGILRRARYIHDSLLESFRTLETVDDSRLPLPESGRFSPTFLTEMGHAHVTDKRMDSVGDSADGSSTLRIEAKA
ncbi:hypothetical protein BCR34DRAFT_520715 [Clohesyomyces aquaticus]|uniref:Rhodopsin domain-containing protein n=1 Tax=Clohesyomyces aquaticus TaxID=1231657 RepID=A0A1Y1YZU9_9PLEO|nr:hypothetical protein BCR34DRAFT_520715 [Clohesyomyces aquaticus]